MPADPSGQVAKEKTNDSSVVGENKSGAPEGVQIEGFISNLDVLLLKIDCYEF
jgi:hypothetical protein